MCFSNVLVSILGQESEIVSRNDLPEDGLCPLFSGLVLVLDLEVL